MVSGYLLDTDRIIDAPKGYTEAIDFVNQLAPSGLAISVISYGEIYQGAYHGSDPATDLAGLAAFLPGKTLLPLTADVMRTFGIVRGGLTPHLQRVIGDMDLLIAATAMHHGLMVVTRNLRHFRLVPNLAIYEPT
ncbi:MAG: hypothetical protein AVDCRST_MAG73-132 [uncultured Thermomicrobiales bacterium]|uniref:PIN domain-containing protein n=1 Tax=uncultured Thermomicrobiales bacterium TaxID=1645740 RepID=A0A6J4TE67_9BACT|nr:MAG: hypothetical protein AVDCRST_MAG73-132 [uncultured Thermomicrobiales bacterium]